MNGHWDDLVKRLTRRLGGDRELQLDLQRELRAHLEDSADEFRRAGEGEEAAAELAIKALGEEAELEQQLWVANRFRMRLRGLLWWAARAALLPGAIAVIVWLVLSMGDGATNPRSNSLPHSWYHQGLSEESKLLLGAGAASRQEQAKALVDLRQDDAVYCANYVQSLLEIWRPDKHPDVPLDVIRQTLDGARRVDPDNGFYDLIEAAILFGRSSRTSEPDASAVSAAKAGGAPAHERLEVTDPEMFRAAMDMFRAALRKPHLAARVKEMVDRRLAVLPEQTRLSHGLWKMKMLTESFSFLDGMYERIVASHVIAHAATLARQGDLAGATQLSLDMQWLGKRLAAGSDYLIDLLVGVAIYRGSLDCAQDIALQAGQDDLAGQIKAHDDACKRVFDACRVGMGQSFTPEQVRRVGAFRLAFMNGQNLDINALKPMVRLEYAVEWELALLYLLACATGLTLLLALAALRGTLRGRERSSVLLFIGWRRMGCICLVAVVAPLGAYALYTAAAMRWGGGFGVNYTFGRVLLEVVLTSSAMLLLLLTMGYSAIRRRAMDLGLPARGPVRIRRRPVLAVLGGVVLLVSLGYIVGWWAGPLRPEPTGILHRWFGLPTFRDELWSSMGGMILAGAAAIVMAAWLVDEFVRLLRGRAERVFCSSVYRNLVPLLAACVILVGLVCGAGLSVVEASAARQVTGDADPFVYRDELAAWKPLQAFVAAAPLWTLEPASPGNTTAHPAPVTSAP